MFRVPRTATRRPPSPPQPRRSGLHRHLRLHRAGASPDLTPPPPWASSSPPSSLTPAAAAQPPPVPFRHAEPPHGKNTTSKVYALRAVLAGSVEAHSDPGSPGPRDPDVGIPAAALRARGGLNHLFSRQGPERTTRDPARRGAGPDCLGRPPLLGLRAPPPPLPDVSPRALPSP